MSRGIGVTETLRETLPEWTAPLFELAALGGDLLLIVPVLGLLYVTSVFVSLRRSTDAGEGPLCSDRSAFVIAVVFGGLALIVLLKAALSLPRPPAELHAVSPSEYGFPSGHTMAATIFWGAIALWSTIGRQRARFAVAAAVVSLVGLSRLALGVHYLVDVVASIAFGLVYLAVVAGIANGRPGRAFVIAIAIAGIAVLVGGEHSRALLALAGSVGVGVSWWVLEQASVRRRPVRTVERGLSG
ncbi:phosphatase PAP2 family protein [Natronorubrum halophilum]|uniref:phosphatase PAP2 family protein n=1 Tax=Natronorubrum halophilum TaxID=1702106 RepID=UPI0010C18124|nr:phosphatase PAP2 family protein [Natronorubrum halophilum]